MRASVGEAHIRNLPPVDHGRGGQGWVRNLVACSAHFAEAVCQDGKNVAVDSSKEITRALFLLRFVSGSRVIYLVRHLARILESGYHRLKTAPDLSSFGGVQQGPVSAGALRGYYLLSHPGDGIH